MIAVTKAEHYAAHRKPTCPKGHVYTPENTYMRPDNGARTCKQCRAAYMRKYYLGKSETRPAARPRFHAHAEELKGNAT